MSRAESDRPRRRREDEPERTWRPSTLNERLFQQFVSTDRANARRTYSRACTVKRGEFILVRVPWDPETGVEARAGLTEDELRFVEHNITPAEFVQQEEASS